METIKSPGEANRQIYYTNDYGMFGWIPGNRLLDERRIRKICHANQVAGINLFPYVPILVTKDHKVIDGQTRLMAAKRLQTLIYFIYIDDMDVSKIARINSVTKTWGAKDYLNCWINLKSDDYMELEQFMLKYHIPISSSIKLLMNGKLGKVSGGTGAGTHDAFQNGQFRVNFRDYAEKIGSMYNEYLKIADFTRSRYLLISVAMLNDSDKYQHNEVIQKLTVNGARIEIQGSSREFISHIELLYNKGNQKRRVIF